MTLSCRACHGVLFDVEFCNVDCITDVEMCGVVGMLFVTEDDIADGDRAHHVGDGAEGRVVAVVVLPWVGLLVAKAIDDFSSRFEDVACGAHCGAGETAAALEGDG